MKSLISYLLEDKRTYDFKIKIANMELTNDILDRLEHSLNGYEIVSMSKPKSLPIEDQSLDFPSLNNCEVSLITVSLKYPCTDDQVRTAISNQGRLPMANVVVIPKNQPEELMRDAAADEPNDKNKEPILTKELEHISGGQLQVGAKRVESLLKELETRRYEIAAKEKVDTKSTNDLPQNNTSVVDTNAHKPKGR